MSDDYSLSRVTADGDVVEFTLIEPPAPGIYEDMPAEEYHKIHAASASRLKKLRRSPLHMQHSILNPEETEAMELGTIIHARLLESDRFAREYVLAPKFDRRTKVGKQMAEDFEIENLGKKIVTADHATIAEGIYDSVMAHPEARKLIEDQGMVEASVFWQDKDSGVNCKMRCDKHVLFEGNLILLDVKSTTDASPDAFSSDIYRYGYYIQAAMYLDGMSTVLEENHSHFRFLAVEKSAPFAVALYKLESEAIEFGRAEYKRLLKLYAECERTQVWPGYTPITQPINIPAWAYKR